MQGQPQFLSSSRLQHPYGKSVLTQALVPQHITNDHDFSDNTPSTSSCRICKKTNHSTNDCRFKPSESKPETSNKVPAATSACTYCKKSGHTYETCFKRERSLTSNVNCVASNKLAPITIKIGEKTLQAVFDSGAEWSIIRETIATTLPGQLRRPVVNYLKWIGQVPALSLTKLTTMCC